MFAEAINPFEEVVDGKHWEFFKSLGLELHLRFGITKYMILELIVAGLILAIYLPLARKVQTGQPVKGAFWNAWEVLLTFIRDKVAKPLIGPEADQFVPFLWTLFLFVLFSNLLGLIPFMGSPTANIFVTGGLALVVFFIVHGSAIAKLGSERLSGHGGHGAHGHGDHGHAEPAAVAPAAHDAHAAGAHPANADALVFLRRASVVAAAGLPLYLKSYVPHFDNVPWIMKVLLVPGITALEIFSQFIRTFVLAVRLFANMFAGHTVLAVILLFIVMVKDQSLLVAGPITLASVLGVVALSLLELFVGFLQAYIFVFLTSLYIGSALHPAH